MGYLIWLLLAWGLLRAHSFCQDEARTSVKLVQQLMMMQQISEEMLRSNGASGIKQVRQNSAGTRPYFGESHSSDSQVFSIHDHSEHVRTVGLGEFTAVLNGVEFRTRHNDYLLRMPHRTSGKYHAVEDILFPDIPPAVSEKSTIQEQVEEMREWFKAWQSQNHSERDYRQYFRPVLCYLEGAWTNSVDNLEESFDSDRHYLDADSWLDLQQKTRFAAYTGTKDEFENFAFLPTTILKLSNDTTPVFAQWNYRILCHPVTRHLPLNRFRVIDDVTSRMRKRLSLEELSMTRSARFQLNPADSEWREAKEGTQQYGLLDQLMAEIPGKDNYGALLHDGNNTSDFETGQRLNAAFYHRWYKVQRPGAMGRLTRHRGFSDEHVFMAKTTQAKVAGVDTNVCSWTRNETVCRLQEEKWTYAVPLEVIYLTPLNTWNPYNITYWGDADSTAGQTAIAGNRNGGNSTREAYNGTNSKVYYLSPKRFFDGDEVLRDAADTSQSSVVVLDRQSNQCRTAPSGIRVFFPKIFGVGTARQRYPIMPLYGEGSPVWKELEALKDLVLRPEQNARLFYEKHECVPCSTVKSQVTNHALVQLLGLCSLLPFLEVIL